MSWDMRMTERTDTGGLDDLLHGARDSAVPPALMKRVLADADIHAPRPAPELGVAPLRSRLGEMLREIGGWPSLAGLAAASATGIAIGIASPQAVFPVGGATPEAAFEIVDLVPGYGLDGALED